MSCFSGKLFVAKIDEVEHALKEKFDLIRWLTRSNFFQFLVFLSDPPTALNAGWNEKYVFFPYRGLSIELKTALLILILDSRYS